METAHGFRRFTSFSVKSKNVASFPACPLEVTKEPTSNRSVNHQQNRTSEARDLHKKSQANLFEHFIHYYVAIEIKV
jgi:hypothetical protein